MRVRRTLPPTASPLRARDVLRGAAGLFGGDAGARARAVELGAYLGVPHVFPTASGTAALTLILRGLKSLSPRRAVVVPAYTCFTVPAAVRKAGLDVVPCDVAPETLDFDPDALKRAVTGDTLCVVPSNLLGRSSALGPIGRIARERGAWVVDDAAQALGVEVDGCKAGARGDVGFLSFGRGKHVTGGSGGAVVTGSDAVAEAVAAQYAALRPPPRTAALTTWAAAAFTTAFIDPDRYGFPSGLPFLKLGQTVYRPDFPEARMGPVQAALLGGWRERLAAQNAARTARADALIERLGGLVHLAPGLPYLRLPVLAPSPDARDRLVAASRERGLGLARLYPCAVDAIPALAGALPLGPPCAGAREAAERLVTVPTHPLLIDADVDRIVDLLTEMLPERGNEAPRVSAAEALRR